MPGDFTSIALHWKLLIPFFGKSRFNFCALVAINDSTLSSIYYYISITMVIFCAISWWQIPSNKRMEKRLLIKKVGLRRRGTNHEVWWWLKTRFINFQLITQKYNMDCFESYIKITHYYWINIFRWRLVTMIHSVS